MGTTRRRRRDIYGTFNNANGVLRLSGCRAAALTMSALLAGACSVEEPAAHRPASSGGSSAAAPAQAVVTGAVPQAPRTAPAPVPGDTLPPLQSAQPVSEFPIDNEWFASIPGIDDFRELTARAYAEWQRRIAACMTARGFTYVPPTLVDARNVDLFRALNPLNEQAAMIWGFHAPATPEIVDPNDASDPAYALARDGSDDGEVIGCAQSANDVAYESVDPINDGYSALVAGLSDELQAYVTTPEGVSGTAAWAACMTSAGYAFANPGAAVAAYAARPAVEDDERTARLASIGCDRQIEVTQRRSEWQRIRFDAWLDAQGVVLSELQGDVRTAAHALDELAREPLSSQRATPSTMASPATGS